MTSKFRFTLAALTSLLVAGLATACGGKDAAGTTESAGEAAATETTETAPARPTAPSATGPLRVLFVGNSHTDYYVSLPKMFGELAAHNGKDVQVDTLVEMGISMDEIYQETREQAEANFAKTDPDGNYYDYVVLQEKTPVAATEPEAYRASVKMFADKVRQNSPGAAVYVYQLMSPLDFATEHADFLMWDEELRRNADGAATSISNAGVYRLGDAIRQAYEGAHGYNYKPDGADRLRHGENNLHMLNDAGFMASVLLYETLFDKTPNIPAEMSFATGTDDDDVQKPQAVADSVSSTDALLKIVADTK